MHMISANQSSGYLITFTYIYVGNPVCRHLLSKTSPKTVASQSLDPLQ